MGYLSSLEKPSRQMIKCSHPKPLEIVKKRTLFYLRCKEAIVVSNGGRLFFSGALQCRPYEVPGLGYFSLAPIYQVVVIKTAGKISPPINASPKHKSGKKVQKCEHHSDVEREKCR